MAQFPGSCHDSYILRMSDLHDDGDNGQFGNYYLLGDSAYTLRKWIMTPFLYPSTVPEQHYNDAHKTTRCTVERSIGHWKGHVQ